MEQRPMNRVSPLSSFRRARASRGFTLVELLTVLSIMGLLLYIVAPVSTSLTESSKMAFAGQIVGDHLAVARQYAASRNECVEVRFIDMSGALNGYNAIQLWLPGTATAAASPLDALVQLPTGIEVSANTRLSPLVSSLTGAAAIMPAGTPGADKNYVYFTVRPTGNIEVANPPSGEAVVRQPSYFFTLLPNRDDASSALPPNYLTIQVNPDTGNAAVFRP
jgi:uncharacterized protein (TIGR02596 family)